MGQFMTDKLEQAARAVLDAADLNRQRVRNGEDFHRINAGVIDSLRAALDAEPEPSPTNEERAREIYRKALDTDTSENIHDVIPRMFVAEIAAAEARGLERAAEACIAREAKHDADRGKCCDEIARHKCNTRRLEAWSCAAAIRALREE